MIYCIGLAIAAAVIAVRGPEGVRPSWFPFPPFKLCRIGSTTSVEHHKTWCPGVFEHPYLDVRFTQWRDELNRRNKITVHEWMALDLKMFEELQTLNAKREKSASCNASI